MTSMLPDAEYLPVRADMPNLNSQFKALTSILDLDYLALTKIFRMLSIADRLSCERVCGLWRKSMVDIWNQQRRLHLSHSSLCLYNCCGKQAHRANAEDAWIAPSKRSPMPRSILKKCANLKVLYWDFGAADDFGRLLAKFCPKLEHLHVDWGCVSMDSILDYARNVASVELKCVHLYRSMADWDSSEYVSKLEDFLQLCPKIENIGIQHVFGKCDK